MASGDDGAQSELDCLLRRLEKIHTVMLVVWVVMAVPSVLVWKRSVEYLVFVSVYAIIATHTLGRYEARIERIKDGDTAADR